LRTAHKRRFSLWRLPVHDRPGIGGFFAPRRSFQISSRIGRPRGAAWPKDALGRRLEDSRLSRAHRQEKSLRIVLELLYLHIGSTVLVGHTAADHLRR